MCDGLPLLSIWSIGYSSKILFRSLLVILISTNVGKHNLEDKIGLFGL